MDGITRLWQDFFKVAPGPAILLLVFGIWHLFLKDMFAGTPKTGPKENSKAEADGKTQNPTEANSSNQKTTETES